jgi:hypothetical protein
MPWRIEDAREAVEKGRVKLYQRARLGSGQEVHTASYRQPKADSSSAVGGSSGRRLSCMVSLRFPAAQQPLRGASSRHPERRPNLGEKERMVDYIGCVQHFVCVQPAGQQQQVPMVLAELQLFEPLRSEEVLGQEIWVAGRALQGRNLVELSSIDCAVVSYMPHGMPAACKQKPMYFCPYFNMSRQQQHMECTVQE